MGPELPPLCQDWLDDLVRRGRHPTTIAAYRVSLTHFLSWYQATYHDAFLPPQVMPRDVRNWQAHQQLVEHSAPATINRRLVALKQFFGWMPRSPLA